MSVSFSLSSSWNNEAAAPLSFDVSVTNTVSLWIKCCQFCLVCQELYDMIKSFLVMRLPGEWDIFFGELRDWL